MQGVLGVFIFLVCDALHLPHFPIPFSDFLVSCDVVVFHENWSAVTLTEDGRNCSEVVHV